MERKVDPNSNFRKYYLNDPQFYTAVIRKEEPPYEFKIHIFLDKNEDGEEEYDTSKSTTRALTLTLLDKL